MAFLKNVWYAAAWADELGEQTLLARTIAEEPLVMFRDKGVVVSLHDRCPHRHAPLSMGRLTAGGIQCGYHGVEFNSGGSCISNPHGAIVSALQVRAYATIERYGIIWVWLGSVEKADSAVIPDMSFVSLAPATACSKGYLPTVANHLLLVDNILDLSHADYLHASTLGGGVISRTRAKIEERDSGLFVVWHTFNELPIPVFKPLMPTPQSRCDSWTEVTWFPSGVMLLQVGATPAGQPRESGVDTWNAHIMTPESEGRTHYFYYNSRNYLVDDTAYNALFAAGLSAAFQTEDKPMIEAQQRRIGNVDLLKQNPVLLSIDSASMRARKKFNTFLEAEAA